MRKFYSKQFNSPLFITCKKPHYLLFRHFLQVSLLISLITAFLLKSLYSNGFTAFILEMPSVHVLVHGGFYCSWGAWMWLRAGEFLRGCCPPWACPVSGAAPVVLSHDSQHLAAVLTLDTLALCSCCSHCTSLRGSADTAPCGATLWIGSGGTHPTWTILPPFPQMKPGAGSVPLVWLSGWSHKWFCWADGMLAGHRGKEQTITLALPNTVFLKASEYKQMKILNSFPNICSYNWNLP